MSPQNAVEVAEILRQDTAVAFGDFGVFSVQRSALPRISSDRLTGIVAHDVDDQVVTVRAGTSIAELQEALRSTGQCLPLDDSTHGSVADSLFLNLPHRREGLCGTWRDWVLGLSIVMADGTIAKCGSRAVKNVAGYDVQKLLIGSRGTLAFVSEVIVRTYPLRALPPVPETHGHPNWIQRTLRSDFPAAVKAAGSHLIGTDEGTCTLWADVPAGLELHRFPHDWVVAAGRLELNDPTLVKYTTRAKDIFDPSRKLNPGEMGIF